MDSTRGVERTWDEVGTSDHEHNNIGVSLLVQFGKMRLIMNIERHDYSRHDRIRLCTFGGTHNDPEDQAL